MEENCCLHLEPKQDDEKCIIISTNGDILRPTHSCVQYFYDFYIKWLQRSESIIHIMAIVFCVILGVAILRNIWLLVSLELGQGSYTVEKRAQSKYRHNISSLTYVPFQSDIPIKESSKNTLDSDIFCITKNDDKSISAFGPSVCIMHDY